MKGKLKERIKYYKSEGLNHDCSRCKALGHEAKNALERRCGSPCKVDKRTNDKIMVQEIKLTFDLLNKGQRVTLA